MALQDKGFNDPQIEVRSQSPRLEMLQSRLRQAGLRPVLAGEMLHPGTSDPYLVDVATLCRADLEEVVDAWRAAGQSRPLVMLGAIPTELRHLPILHIRDTDQLSSLGPRLAIRQRESRRRRELGLRVSTAERLGLPLQALPTSATQRVLYLGDSSPAFIALRAALKACGIETVAALSAYTARDYLSSGRFAAAIVHPVSPTDEAAVFLSRFDTLHASRRPELVLIENRVAAVTDIPDPVKALISLRFAADQSPEMIAEGVAARFSADPASPTAEDTPERPQIGAPETLFSRTFLESHLAAQLEQADESGEPISLLAINMTKATDQEDFVQLVNQMLRDADMAARLDDANICITLPATPYRGAIAFARRIESAWGRSMSFRAVERRQFHTVETLIGALVGKPVLRRLKQA